jgi:hypothetical protein
MFAMAPTNWYHAIIKSHAAGEMGNQLENGPCCVLTSGSERVWETGRAQALPVVAV